MSNPIGDRLVGLVNDRLTDTAGLPESFRRSRYLQTGTLLSWVLSFFGSSNAAAIKEA